VRETLGRGVSWALNPMAHIIRRSQSFRDTEKHQEGGHCDKESGNWSDAAAKPGKKH
jgi:hypothetical protein